MRIEAHDKFGKVIKSDITRIVIYDDYDNPISFSLRYAQGRCHTSHIGEKEFHNLLKMFGLDKVVIVENLDVDELNNNLPTTKIF